MTNEYLPDFSIDCGGVGKPSTAEITVRLDHEGTLFIRYCVVPRVYWGKFLKKYDRVCNIPTNEDYTFTVTETLTEADEGSLTTHARVTVDLALVSAEKPHDVQLYSSDFQMTLDGNTCEGSTTTEAPVSSPTNPDSPTSPTPVTPTEEDGAFTPYNKLLSFALSVSGIYLLFGY